MFPKISRLAISVGSGIAFGIVREGDKKKNPAPTQLSKQTGTLVEGGATAAFLLAEMMNFAPGMTGELLDISLAFFSERVSRSWNEKSSLPAGSPMPAYPASMPRAAVVGMSPFATALPSSAAYAAPLPPPINGPTPYARSYTPSFATKESSPTLV